MDRSPAKGSLFHSLNILSLMGCGINDDDNFGPTATDIENMMNQVTVLCA
jgi:hypothetical protein